MRSSKWPNSLASWVEACGESRSGFAQKLYPDAANALSIINHLMYGRSRPTRETADRVCNLLSEMAGRRVPVAAVFPNVWTTRARGQVSHIPDEAKISRLISGY